VAKPFVLEDLDRLLAWPRDGSRTRPATGS
jgi:hypothetical protein